MCNFNFQNEKTKTMARDLIHEAVKTSLINDGWTITDDPFSIDLIGDERRQLSADIGAEKFFIAEKENRKIVVEIKTFGGFSILNSFHSALGQYLAYRSAMRKSNIDRELFLAVSIEAFFAIQEINFLQDLIQEFELKFIVIDLEEKTVTQWIK